MDYSLYGRSDSSDTSSTGSSYQHILDHVLTYNASYELPLRTMYTLNSTQRTHPSQSCRGTPSTSSSSSPTSPYMPAWQETSPAQAFNESLMAQISNLPTQPTSLPPSFITSFLGKCFTSDLTCVDFPQALTGLDYLKDLELRRRREVVFAMSRLDIDRATLSTDSELQTQYPGVAQWLKSVEDKERKLEALYTQIYVGLRRWIIINELSLTPFNKHNCVAMLNTLFPPIVSTPPTSKLTTSTLKQQRDGYFKYIQAVERSGPRVLSTIMNQGMATGDSTGWPSVVRTLNQYLQLASSMITECITVGSVQESPKKATATGKTHKAKTDSGISLSGTDFRRPSTAASSVVEPASPIEPARPKTPSNSRGTALEKLARGLKTIGRSRTDVTEINSREDMFAQKPKGLGLRKMRSMGALSTSSRNSSTSHDRNPPAFDAEEMKRQRLKYESGEQALGGGVSHEV